MKREEIFNCFEDFWVLTQDFTDFQRNKILKALPQDKANSLIKEIKMEKWEDLIYRNKIDKIIDEIKEKFSVDLLDKRRKALKGKSQYISFEVLDYFISSISEMDIEKKHYHYILGGLKVERDGNAFCIYTTIKNKEKYGSKE